MDCKIIAKIVARNISKKRSKPSANNLKKVFTNPELAKFTPRHLMDELKARGYTGELQYTQKITL